MAAGGKDSKAKEPEKTEGETAAAEAAPAKAGLFARIPKLALLGGAGALVLALAGAGVWFFVLSGGGGDEHAHGKESAHAEAEADQSGPSVFVDLPEMVVNLAGTGAQTSYLKLRVSLEVGGEEAAKAVEPVTPKVIDQFQLFLRELRVEDLQGSAGTFRLKEELLRRVNAAAEPVKVRDVLFKEMLIQ